MINFHRFTEILEENAVDHDFLGAIGQTRQRLADAHRVLQRNTDPQQQEALLKYMEGLCKAVAQTLGPFDRKPVMGSGVEFRMQNTSLASLVSGDGRLPRWIEEALKNGNTDQILQTVEGAEKTLTDLYNKAGGGRMGGLHEPMIQKPITWHAESVLEYEIHVDRDGYAYDDEGNREYVGKRFRGTYTPRSMRQMKDMGLPTPVDAMDSTESRPRVEVDQRKVEALQKALAIRPNEFLSSILSQVKDGRVLTDAQKKAVRQNFYRLRMKEDADLFR